MKRSRPDIIFVMLDSLRSDCMRAYGGGLRLRTIDNIGTKGVVYKKAIAPGTYTVPSLVSLFLGRRAKGVKTLKNDPLRNYNANTDPLQKKIEYIRPNETTLARQMSYLGYDTAAFSNNPFVSQATGIASGFSHNENIWLQSKIDENSSFVKTMLGMVQSDTVRNRLVELAYLTSRLIPRRRLDDLYLNLRMTLNRRFSEANGFYDLDAGADLTNRLVDRYLKGNQKRSNFIFINYMEGREGYPTNLVSKDYVEQDKWLYMSGILDSEGVGAIKRAYYRRLAYLDSKLANLLGVLKKNGALDNALLILSSDHGQAFMEHGQMYHNMFPYEELSRVPLIVGKFENGRQVNTKEAVDPFVSITALHDAILDVGYGQTDEIDGRLRRDSFVFSDHVGITEVWDAYLLKLLGRRSKYADAIYKTKQAHNRFATAIYYKNFKLVSYKNGGKELYDIEGDPDESEDVIGKNRGIALKMLNAEKIKVN